MAIDTDLTTTLRITPEIDTAAAQSIGARIATAINQQIGAGIGGGGAGGVGARPGSTTTSTAAPGYTPYSPSYPGPPTPGTNTTSTAGGAGGGVPPGGGAGGGGAGGPGPGGAYPMGLQGSPRAVDFSRYMIGGGVVTTTTSALVGGLFHDRLAQGAIALGTGAFSESIVRTAREKAQMIDEMRQSGTPESMLPGMGALAFAGPIGAAASVVGQFAAQSIDKGLSLQEQYSRRYGQGAREMALGYQSGALPSNEGYTTFLARAAQIRNGALDESEARQAFSTYARGIGFRDQSPLDYLRLGMTGVSAESIAGFRANARFGARANQSDIEGLIGTGQSAGLTGSGLDSLLQQLNATVRSLALRGIRLDETSTRRMLDRGVGAGVAPEIGAQGIAQAAGNVASLRDQALSPFKAYGDALVQMQALRGARSYEDYVGNLERVSGNAEELGGVLRPGGRLVGAGYYGGGLRNALSTAPPVAGEGNRRPGYFDTGMWGGLKSAFEMRQSTAETERNRFEQLQSSSAYEAQQRFVRGSDAATMDWKIINEAKGTFLGAIEALNSSIREGLRELGASLGARP